MNRTLMVVSLLALLTAGGWWLFTRGEDAMQAKMQQAQLEALEAVTNQYKQKEAKANEARDKALILERQSGDRSKRLERELRLANKNQPVCIIGDDIVRVLDEAVRDPALPVRADSQGLVAADGTVTADTISESRFLAVEAYNNCARIHNAIIEHVKTQE